MIKIIINIKEDERIDFENVTGINVKCEINSKEIKATEYERKVMKEIKKKLETNKPVQVINNSSNKRLERLLNELLSI